MFGVFVVFYLFLGGTGAGAVVTCSLADLVLVRQPFGTSAYVQGPSVRPEARIVDFGFVAGFALLVAGIACLLLDLGRIDRVLSLFLNPQPTLLTVGSFALAALAVLAAFLAAVRFLYLPGVRRPVVAVVEAGAVAVAAVVMLYTGLLLQTVGGVAFWATPFVPALFVLSSVSGGAAVVLAGAFFVECDERASWLLGRFVRADVVVIVLEVACAAGFLLWADGSAHRACRPHLRGWCRAMRLLRGGWGSSRAGLRRLWPWRRPACWGRGTPVRACANSSGNASARFWPSWRCWCWWGRCVCAGR